MSAWRDERSRSLGAMFTYLLATENRDEHEASSKDPKTRDAKEADEEEYEAIPRRARAFYRAACRERKRNQRP